MKQKSSNYGQKKKSLKVQLNLLFGQVSLIKGRKKDEDEIRVTKITSRMKDKSKRNLVSKMDRKIK